MEQRKNTVKGVGFTLSSAVMYGMVPMLCTLLGRMGINTTMNLIFSSLLGTAMLCVLIRAKGISMKLSRREKAELLLFAGLLAGGTSLLLILSYNYLSGGVATALHFLYPCIISVCGIAFFREKATAAKVISVTLSLLSTILLCADSRGMSKQLIGIALAVCSAVCYSGFTIASEHSALSNQHAYMISLYISFCTLIMSLAYGLLTDTITLSSVRASNVPWILLLVLTHVLFHSIFATPCYQIGVRTIGASSAALLSAFEPITALAISGLVFSEELSRNQAIGALMIVISVVLTAYDNLRLTRKARDGS